MAIASLEGTAGLAIPAHESLGAHGVSEALQQVDGQQLLGIDPVPVIHLDTQGLRLGLLHHQPLALIPDGSQRVLLVLLHGAENSQMIIKKTDQHYSYILLLATSDGMWTLKKSAQLGRASGHA